MLGARQRSVRELADALPVSRPAVSRHLRLLKSAGLVEEHAEGTRRVYRLQGAVSSAGVLASSPLIAFVATASPERARWFYADVLGLALRSEDDFAQVFDANGIMLRVVRLDTLTPLERTVLGWQVDDIQATVRALGERGVSFERYSFVTQDELGIWTTPDGSRVAWFKDPDGNLLSLTQLA